MIPRPIRIFLLLLILPGCAVRSVYVPASQNVILFDENRQIQANGYVGINTLQLQLAHNPVKHFLFGLNNMYGSGLLMYEGFAGFYNHAKTEAKWRYECLAGGGYTSNYAHVIHGSMAALQNKSSNFETNSEYTKVFVQPSLGYFSGIKMYKLRYFFSIGARASYIDFKKYIYREIDADNSRSSGSTVYLVNKEFRHKNLFLLEPCITNKVRLKNVSAVLQAMVMIPYSSQINIRYTKFSPVVLFSLGIQYNFIIKHKSGIKE